MEEIGDTQIQRECDMANASAANLASPNRCGTSSPTSHLWDARENPGSSRSKNFDSTTRTHNVLLQTERTSPTHHSCVNQDTGCPGEGFTGADANADRESVFQFNWYDIVPPTPEELSKAFDRGYKKG